MYDKITKIMLKINVKTINATQSSKKMRMQPLLACAVIIVYSILKSVILLLYDKLHHKI